MTRCLVTGKWLLGGDWSGDGGVRHDQVSGVRRPAFAAGLDLPPPFRTLAGENVPDRFVVPTVAAAIDLVLHLEVDGRGRRRVREIVGVPGRAEGGIVETADLFHLEAGALVRGDGYPPHPDRFAGAGIDLPALMRGER